MKYKEIIYKSTYRNLFAKTGLTFKKPAMDTCSSCDSLAIT